MKEYDFVCIDCGLENMRTTSGEIPNLSDEVECRYCKTKLRVIRTKTELFVNRKNN